MSEFGPTRQNILGLIGSYRFIATHNDNVRTIFAFLQITLNVSSNFDCIINIFLNSKYPSRVTNFTNTNPI